MSEPMGEDFPPVTRGNRTDTILVELGSVKTSAAMAADAARRTEAAVSSLAVRVNRLEVDLAALKASTEAERADRPPRTPIATWVSLGISVLLALYVVLDHTPSP